MGDSANHSFIQVAPLSNNLPAREGASFFKNRKARADNRFFVAHLEIISGEIVASGLSASLIARMKMSSIDRAARAFALAASGIDEWDTLDVGTQERLREAVCAALMSIREPSAPAVRAGVRRSKRVHRSSARQAKTTWQAMVDATVEDR
jgi:hypothetical protein